MTVRHRPVNPWLFWSGMGALVIAIALADAGPLPTGNGSTLNVGVLVGWLAIVLFVLSWALPVELADVVRAKHRAARPSDGAGSRPEEQAPRAGGPPVP